MSDIVKLYKEIMEIDNILKNILQNEQLQTEELTKITQIINSENELLNEINFTNYFRNILI